MAIFMKWGSIAGGATDAKHKEWIPVESANFSLSKGADIQTGQGTELRSVGPPAFSDIDVVVNPDKSLPLLVKDAVNGTAADATIHYCRMKGDPYQEVKLKNCLITAVNGVGEDGHDLTINYTAICVVFYNQDAKSGQTGQTKAGWDILENKELIW